MTQFIVVDNCAGANDDEKMDAAIAQAASTFASNSQGSTLYLEPGDKNWSKTHTISTPGVTVEADRASTRIFRHGDYGNTLEFVAPKSALLDGCIARGLYFFDAGGMESGYHFHFDNVTNAFVEDCRIVNGWQFLSLLTAQGFSTEGDNDWRTSSYPNNTAGRYGVYIGGSAIAGTAEWGDQHFSGRLEMFCGDMTATPFKPCMAEGFHIEACDGVYWAAATHIIGYANAAVNVIVDDVRQQTNLRGSYFGDIGGGPSLNVQSSDALPKTGSRCNGNICLYRPAQEPVFLCAAPNLLVQRTPLVEYFTIAATDWSASTVPVGQFVYKALLATSQLPPGATLKNLDHITVTPSLVSGLQLTAGIDPTGTTYATVLLSNFTGSPIATPSALNVRLSLSPWYGYP